MKREERRQKEDKVKIKRWRKCLEIRGHKQESNERTMQRVEIITF